MTIAILLSEFFKKYGSQSAKLEKEIKKRINDGQSADEAIRGAMDYLGFEQRFVKDIEKLQVYSVGVGASIKVTGLAMFREALNKAWSMDGVPLSKRLHGATVEMRNKIVDTVGRQIKLNATAKQTALALYDGYGYGKVINQQALPKYLQELVSFAKQSTLSNADRFKLQAMIRSAENKVKRLSQNGAPTKMLKATYSELLEHIELSADKALDKAIYTAIQEKSRYVAERIARTEASRAWFDGFIAKNHNNAMVVAYKWKLNSRHPVFDICDLHSKADMFGLGSGVFPKDKVPRLPAHPHCLCYLAPVFIGEVDLAKSTEQINRAGQEWLNRLNTEQQALVLGVEGAKEFKDTGQWQDRLRGWSGLHNPVSRIKDFKG